MKIGIVGVGMVGSALSFGFRRIGHQVIEHDVKLNTALSDVIVAPVVFVCVPTPSLDNGACDVSRVNQVVMELVMAGYTGLVVIKSTVMPGTTQALEQKFPKLRLAFCPEFLRERARFSDFVENQDVLVIGAENTFDVALIRDAHGSLPKKIFVMPPLEAELAKYFSNTFNALRIVFANQFWEVCEMVGADYQKIREAMTARPSIGTDYLDCNDQFRAFGGACLPKDTRAFAQYAAERAPGVELFRQIVEHNDRVLKETK